MKQLLMAIMMIIISLAANAQETKKITAPKKPQRAHLDYFLKIDEVKGESPDTLPPAPSLFSINAGGTMSQTSNSNLAERYSAQYVQGFTVGIGYAKEFRKSRLQINAGYQKGWVRCSAIHSIQSKIRTCYCH